MLPWCSNHGVLGFFKPIYIYICSNIYCLSYGICYCVISPGDQCSIYPARAPRTVRDRRLVDTRAVRAPPPGRALPCILAHSVRALP